MTEYTRYRAQLGFEKFPEYIKHLKSLYPTKDLHHILGSVTAKKFTDALLIPLDHEFHLCVVERNKALCFEKYLKSAFHYFYHWAKERFSLSDEYEKYRENLEPESIKEFIKIVYAYSQTK